MSQHWKGGPKQRDKGLKIFGRCKHQEKQNYHHPVAMCFKTSGKNFTIIHFLSIRESLAKDGGDGWTLGSLGQHGVDMGHGKARVPPPPSEDSLEEDKKEDPLGQSPQPPRCGASRKCGRTLSGHVPVIGHPHHNRSLWKEADHYEPPTIPEFLMHLEKVRPREAQGMAPVTQGVVRARNTPFLSRCPG